PAEISRHLECCSKDRTAVLRAPLHDLALPLEIEQVDEAFWSILPLYQIGVVANGAEHGEGARVHAIRIDLLRWEVPGYVLRQIGGEQAVAFPGDKMRSVCAADDIYLVKVDLLFFADALKDTLRSRSLNLDNNARILGLERLAEGFCDRDLHGRVERDHVLLPGGLDQGRADRGRIRCGGLEQLWKEGGGSKRRRALEHGASGKLAVSHCLAP